MECSDGAEKKMKMFNVSESIHVVCEGSPADDQYGYIVEQDKTRIGFWIVYLNNKEKFPNNVSIHGDYIFSTFTDNSTQSQELQNETNIPQLIPITTIIDKSRCGKENPEVELLFYKMCHNIVEPKQYDHQLNVVYHEDEFIGTE